MYIEYIFKEKSYWNKFKEPYCMNLRRSRLKPASIAFKTIL